MSWSLSFLAFGLLAPAIAEDPADPAIVVREFLYERAPFPSCHASTIAETPDGLVASWFGGSNEGKPDVGIWVSRHDGRAWSAPVEVVDGRQSDGTRHPCWNPVLHQVPGGPLLLYSKVGPSPRTWWGIVQSSDDRGKTWSAARRLPDGILGPIKNKPVLLADGTLLCPSSTEHDGWRAHIERTADGGRTWAKTESLADGRTVGIIQPTILVQKGGDLQALFRSRQKAIYESWSKDGGRTWSEPTPTPLPNPSSGVDAVTLKDGRSFLVYNHTTAGRSPLNTAISEDGKTWKAGPVLESEPGEYSYPAVIQAADGTVHVTYTHQRKKIRHVAIDPAKIVFKDLPR